jgi:hypothetical protein
MILTAAFLLAAAPKPVDTYDYEQPLEKADYEGRSLRELTLMRNFPYAQAGNPFRRKWLDAYFRSKPWYKRLDMMDLSLLVGAMRENAEKVGAYEALLTKDELIARRDAVRAKKELTADDKLELRLLSVRLGGWAGTGAEPSDLNPLESPARLDKLLKLKDLDDLSPRDLKLLRNMVFARRGRPFKTPLVQGFFNTVAWYKSDPEYTDARLTEIDKKNVQLIASLEQRLKWEQELGGPEALDRIIGGA